MITWPDSAAAELAAIERLIDLPGQVLLDVGCGDGRVTLALAQHARRTIGLDIDAEELTLAQADTPAELAPKIMWLHGQAEHLPLPNNSVDVLLWGWSFWNIAIEEQPAALAEGLRVVRSSNRSALLDVRPQKDDPQIGVRWPNGHIEWCGALMADDPAVFARHSNADIVMQHAFAIGQLMLIDSVEFDWINRYKDADDLLTTVLENWTARTISESVALKLTQIFADAPPGSRPFISQRVLARCLRHGLSF